MNQGNRPLALSAFDLYLPKMHPAAQDFHHAARTAAALDRFEMLSLFRLEIPQVLKRLKVWGTSNRGIRPSTRGLVAWFWADHRR